MSGSSFDYAYFEVRDFADNLAEKIFENPAEYSEPTMAELRKLVIDARAMADKMRAVEFLYSGDYSEENTMKELKL